MSQYPTDIPEVGGNLDMGNYLFTVKSATDSVTKNGKRQFEIVLGVVEPALLKGNQHTERLVIGTENDPQALDPLTWKTPPSVYAASRFVQLLNAAGVGTTGSTEKDLAAVAGQAVGGFIQVTVEPAIRKDGTANEYAGRERSQIRKFFKPGERMPGVGDGKAPAARPTPRPTVRPTVDE